MKVLFATSECVPFIKTGGLADVVGALPSELCAQGCEAFSCVGLKSLKSLKSLMSLFWLGKPAVTDVGAT